MGGLRFLSLQVIFLTEIFTLVLELQFCFR